MPVYTYHCDNCENQFDKQQSFNDSPLTTCPECGKKRLHKVYKPVNIVFKGSGFYATDHHSASGGVNGSGPGSNGTGKQEKGETEEKAKKTETPSSEKA